jgi:hypothetical protein
MSDLKKSLIKKTEIEVSKKFDDVFFEKLHNEQARPKVFSTWITWLISGFATASVLFIAISSYNLRPHHAFNHNEYIDSMLELQDTVNDGISDDNRINLTVMHTDGI